MCVTLYNISFSLKPDKIISLYSIVSNRPLNTYDPKAQGAKLQLDNCCAQGFHSLHGGEAALQAARQAGEDEAN